MPDVTRILNAIEQGDPNAAEQLLPLVYGELRKLAAQRLANEKPGQTLQATALVHEAYLRLMASTNHNSSTRPVPKSPANSGKGEREKRSSVNSPHWNSKGHFFAAAAEAMRRILVEQARRKRSAKGGGQLVRVQLNDEQLVAPNRQVDLLALNEALDRLARQDHRKAELVKLRYFVGLTIREAAAALGIAESTADADWAYAKSWLRVELTNGQHDRR